jgi:hypothetical protein
VALAPAFIGAGRIESTNLATANTATDGTGAIAPLITGNASGTRVLEIHVKCAATSVAAVINIFLSTDSGTTWRVFDSIIVTAVTQGTTLGGFRSMVAYDSLLLANTAHRLGVTTTISQSTNVFALGGDL